MIVFKCKMCGGEMSLEEGATVAECPYCMTKQTLPKLDNDKRANMYDRANHFRRQNEYDKAMAIFENILQEDRTDAEAYWSLVLCRYGIEYVEDPATHKRVPTVNRVQYTSILADEDYKSALEYADFAQRSVYEEEAKAIDEIQKGILAISKQEKPFDVFICYKETDANGRRTPDSVLANDLYHQLTNEGFKVFFSRITLEDKIGTAYEPYIFAALNSAKVMVVLGTKPEYFNAVWVKNEWSRYLALIRAGADKTLVPAYRDMDPYDLPDEFSHLQAQDMSKLGFMQDLIRGIKKLTTKDTPKIQTVVQQTVGAGANVENLMKRVRLFLEDSNFSSANEYLDRVLDENAEYAPAYIGKVLVNQKLHREEDLGSTLQQYETDPNWAKALRFATPELKKKYETYLENSKQARKEKSLSDQYNSALSALATAIDEQSCYQAKRQFMQISSYKDSQTRMEECDKKALRIAYDRAENKRLAIMRQIKTVSNAKELEKLAPEFEKLGDYADAKANAQLCRSSADTMKESLYDAAKEKLNNAQSVSEVESAEAIFRELGIGYKNASGMLTECQKKKGLLKQIDTLDMRRNTLDRQKTSVALAKQYESLAKEYQALEGNSSRYNACLTKADTVRATLYEEALGQMQVAETKRAYERTAAAFKELEQYRDSEEKARDCITKGQKIEREEAEEKKRQKKSKIKKTVLIISIIVLVISATIVLTQFIIPQNQYNKAVALSDEQKWLEAASAFESAGGYKDSQEKAILMYYKGGQQSLKDQHWEEAERAFKAAGEYSDSETMILETHYQHGVALLNQQQYQEAYNIFEPIIDYKDVSSIISSNSSLAKIATREAKLKPFKTPGSIVTFGTYTQQKKSEIKTEIEWIVLDVKDNKSLLISRYSLDKLSDKTDDVNGKYGSPTWENSNRRKWLNSTFYSTAFTSHEQELIVTTSVDNSKTEGASDSVSDGGPITEDKVFLLSYKEATTYSRIMNGLACKATNYATSFSDLDSEPWWLRTPGYSDGCTMYIAGANEREHRAGSAYGLGFGTASSYVKIRPALWITWDSDYLAER